MRTRRICAFVAVALVLAVLPLHTPLADTTDTSKIVMVIHGGAGTIRRENMTPEKEAAIRGKLAEAVRAGYKILSTGGSSVDAVEAAINVMEDSPLFNAGKGAVFTAEGKNEMDASIMDGSNLNAGAVASVTHIKNPVSAARKVMEDCKHVMLVGAGAEAFAKTEGLAMEDSAYFFTQSRWDALQRVKKEEAERSNAGNADTDNDDKHGTVGALALDADGHLAAATSTGGLTNKMWARVGDSPIIGAGTYADDYTCAVSCSGVGEYFMRGLLAYDVAAQMRYGKKSLQAAVANVIQTKLTGMGGADTGGMIALDRKGHVAMEFNTSGMYRAVVGADGVARTYLYKDDPGVVATP